MQIVAKHHFGTPDEGAGVEKITFELRRILTKTIVTERALSLRDTFLLLASAISFVAILFMFPRLVN